MPSAPDDSAASLPPVTPSRNKRLRYALIAALGAVLLAGAGVATALELAKAPVAKDIAAVTASSVFPSQHFYDGTTAMRRWTLAGHDGSC